MTDDQLEWRVVTCSGYTKDSDYREEHSRILRSREEADLEISKLSPYELNFQKRFRNGYPRIESRVKAGPWT